MLQKLLFIALYLVVQLPTYAQSNTDFEQRLRQLAEQFDFPGFSVSIVDREGVLFSGAYGYADVEASTPYRTDHAQIVASVSKT